jgi:probable rRNA maturation factor
MDVSAEAGVARAPLLRFLRLARAATGLDGEVHVLLADDATLRRLNRQFRSKDKATDVLSFPASASPAFRVEKQLAGDLAISLETAARQAKRFGHRLGDEVRVLMLHGLLHLAGFDHEQDAGQMAARATANSAGRKIRAAVGIGSASGSFDFGPRKGARTSAQDDRKKKVRA